MFMEAVEKAGINGLMSGGATAVLFGMGAQIASPIGNQVIPFPIFAGIVGAGGSVLGDTLHLIMKDAIPVSKKFNDQASLLSGLAVNGVLFAGILYAYQPQVLEDFGMLQALAVGAGAEFAGSASYTYLKENQWL